MKVVVLGAGGFIGSHLVPALEERGHAVTSYDRRDGDLSQPGVTGYLIQRAAPDAVIHLAAQVGRQFGEIDPLFTIQSNTLVTMLVARACADADAHLLYASTSEVYGDQGSDDVYEDSPWRLPYNLYGLSKRWGEEVCDLYAPGTAHMRLAMPFGPGLPAGTGRAAIVNFLAASHESRAITVHRDSERCWCWVGDTVRGIATVLEARVSGPFNIGRDDNPTSMREVAKLANRITTGEGLIVEVEPPSDQVLVKRLRTDRLRALGWAPEVELEEGMRRTYAAMLTLGHLS